MPLRADETLLVVAAPPIAIALALSSFAGHAQAAEPTPYPARYEAFEPPVVDRAEPVPSRPTYFRAFVTAGGGVGLRFNNPYRLSRPLGDDAESLSRTAPYFSLGGGATFGDPFGLQHGATLRWDRSLEGVVQHVVTPSYLVLRRWVHVATWGRLGIPFVLSPNATGGGELAIGGAWFVRAAVGITFEMIGDLFFGAATPDTKNPIYPILSGQLGLVVEWERLP
jgi:hypothetical protein